MSCTNLIAIRIERRRVALAAFSGIRLDYTQVRELPAEYFDARRSARRFVAWAANTFKPEVVVLETVDAPEGSMRANLYEAITRMIPMYSVARIQAPPDAVLLSLGVPRLRTRVELRMAGASIWPELSARSVHPATYDAAMLGLLFQMRSLFS